MPPKQIRPNRKSGSEQVSTEEEGSGERAEVGHQASLKDDQKPKAKNSEEQFDVPFDLVVAAGFGGGPGVRALA